MPVCSICSAEVKPNETICPACGSSIGDETAATSIKPDSQDHTPTKIKSTEAGRIHTTSSVGARFVAGHVLAGRYRIVGLIGKGGMGEVYKAEDLELEQTVALKFLPAELSKEEELLKRFRSEVRTARQVSHPNVCRVFDIGETEGLYYITMEYIDGDDLSVLLRRIGRLPSDKAVEISREIAMGLSAVHSAGILHRDLKPANIIIDSNGKARITDFGIAGIEADVQGAEARVGTPAYMSPEQISGKEVTPRSDIYSLGLLIYEIFTGKQAFEGESVQELREKHTKESPKNPSELVTEIDTVVVDLIQRCLKKDPQERPDSALKVAMMLPGGNPLQVALEAGETPTPEMVAAAPAKGSMSRGVGLALLFGFIALTFLWTIFGARTLSGVLEPVQIPPEVLGAHAQEIARKLGYPERPADTSYGFERDDRVLEYARSLPSRDVFWQKFQTGRPSPIRFEYRQSPRLLIPVDEDASISERDPPMTVPGMVRMELDVAGRLVKFTAVPPLELETNGEKNTDWASGFEEAELPISEFSPVEPRFFTIYNHDEIKAWKGRLPGSPDIPITVEAAAFNGRIVSFQVFGPWSEPADASDSSIPGSSGGYIYVFFSILVVVVFVAAALLARYNLKKGRGDLKGGVKVALFVLILRMITSYISTEKIGELASDTARVNEIFQSTVFLSSLVFLVYLAIEPIIRKSFPELLISWNRLLAGDFRNPLVGRDLLVGVFIGSATVAGGSAMGLVLDTYFENSHTANALLSDASLVPLQNLTLVIGGLLASVWDGVFVGFVFLLLFLAAYLIFRNRWIAAVAFFLLFLIPSILQFLYLGSAGSMLGNFIFFFVFLFCLMRFGYMTAVAYIIAAPTFVIYTFNPEKFFFSSTLLILGFYFLIGLVAFLIATSGQPWLKRDLLA